MAELSSFKKIKNLSQLLHVIKSNANISHHQAVGLDQHKKSLLHF